MATMLRYRLLQISVLFAISAHYVITLECFSCYGNGPGNKCENYSTYENAWKEDEDKRKEDTLFKNCTEPFDKICYIETYYEEGRVISHIRDCGDGETFTFSGDEEKKAYYNRLRSMKWNNETVCVFDLQYMVCLSMCTEDYCNGPSKAPGPVYSTLFCIMTAYFVLFMKNVVS